jgi:hypothetical protein
MGGLPRVKRNVLQKKAPASSGRLFLRSCGLLAVGRVPRDAGNVRAADADVGQFTVTELMQLAQAGVVAPPSLEEVDDCDKHVGLLSFLPAFPRRKSIIAHEIGADCALQKADCCAADMQN